MLKRYPPAHISYSQASQELHSDSAARVYFKNLDGIRFFAAFFVIIEHAQYFKSINPIHLSSYFKEYVKFTGKLGVDIFFVLSGFLISYLLMTEQQKTGNIHVKSFYIRRILRIWPLYFAYGIAMILITPLFFKMIGSPVVITHADTLQNILFLFLFAVNIQLIFFSQNQGIALILWTVCVEE